MSSAAQAAFTVDDLPRFSPWPARLLGLTEWQPRRKTPAEVTREFDRDKWGELLERLGKAAPGSDLEALEGWLRESEEPSLCSVGQHFELLPPRESLRRHYQLVADTLSVLLPASGVVELGAGYGGAMLRLAVDARFTGVPLYAAEYTGSGRELLRRLAQTMGTDLQVGCCDLSAASICDPAPVRGAIVFTCMAAHYVPELGPQFVDAMRQLRAGTVVHFEPCYEHFDQRSLTGALRRRYVEVNDYNRNLVSLLHRQAAAGTIEIVKESPAVIGVNPLLPISVIVWRCKE